MGGERGDRGREGERGTAATHREPLRTHGRSGLALRRRHQGHCNERKSERGAERGGRGGGARWVQMGGGGAGG